jgi:hypothetical protein
MSKYNFIKYHLIYSDLIFKWFFSKITPFSRTAPLRSSVNSARNWLKLSMIIPDAACGIQNATEQGISRFLPSRCTPLLFYMASACRILYTVVLVTSNLLQLQISLPSSCTACLYLIKNTVSLYFYTKLLHVSAIYPVHIHCTCRPNLELNYYGQDMWPKHVAVWCYNYKNVMLCTVNINKLCN